MKIPLPTPKRRVRIEIIPLIDIVFFLLATFVMVSMSMIKNQGIAVNLPAAATGRPQEVAKVLTVTIRENGDVYLGKELVTLPQMAVRLTQLKAADPDVNVLINGDDRASFGRAVAVLDDVRRLGITKVSIRTKGRE